ncbi:MAG: ATP-grasp domain-containing protein [Anaerolineae bacterium]
MKIIFCQDPRTEYKPDSMYIDEVAAATHAGFDFELLDYRALADHDNAARAVRDIPVNDTPEIAIYRGWMLSVTQYESLYDALMSRGIQLFNDWSAYRYAQHLPKALAVLDQHTPHTVWMETDGTHISYDAIMQLLLPFAGQPIILRDFVRSAKHYWHQACYITSASDRVAVQSAVDHFLRWRGDNLEGGLVFREFVPFKEIAEYPRHQKPLINEYRLFFFDHQCIETVRYWDIDGQDADVPPADLFAEVARQVESRFFTMDVAQRADGTWMIIELGDGQVASLPQATDFDAFYRALARQP